MHAECSAMESIFVLPVIPYSCHLRLQQIFFLLLILIEQTVIKSWPYLLHVCIEETICDLWRIYFIRSTLCVHGGNPLCFSRYLGWCVCVLFTLFVHACAWRKPYVSSRYFSCRYRRSIVVFVDAYGVPLQCFIRCCVGFFDWQWFECSYAADVYHCAIIDFSYLFHVCMAETTNVYKEYADFWSNSCMHEGNRVLKSG